ncbi:MAG: DUF1640 domain-containing protein [Gammaproteobacteria bacterium]|jgi:hypothetical protein|nr:DUF1640 domain-containing protein [Gammaproteobacteria bacterium]MBT4605790.1 DUF1640 domain-containing protein [Thiotrichales bacterium]MBT3473847.1 DUF1640 domain-containing protein [Gammaproteobacteria bacterium]MBT3967000.1 DUF1640 domain-containing protein [Gammaproteobacteria bacterium]MBT4080767.1 DUF1640 domain-containing protein [Gammaproteobacteria bacterium]
MNAVTFDTHDSIKDLEASGFTEEQAEALVRVQKKAQEANLEELATKRDLLELKVELIKWFIGSLSLLFALLKLFP